MAKQTAPIQEVARLLDLVPYLSTHSHISVKELAAEFGITEKSMANELMSLSMCGLPGYTPYELIEVFFDTGFVTINNHDALDIPRALTNAEIASLLIGLAMMRESATGHTALIEKIDELSAKLSSLLGSAIEIEPSDLPEVSHLERAIRERRTLSFNYQSSLKTEAETRRVEPLGIYLDRGKSYLSAFCLTAKAHRNFRIDRISDVVVGEPIESPATPQSNPTAPEFSATLQALGRRRAIAEALSIESIPADGTFTYSAFSSEWIERMAIAYLPDLTVIEPAESRVQVADRLQNILALYRS
jgi:proteasome accessory factor C